MPTNLFMCEEIKKSFIIIFKGRNGVNAMITWLNFLFPYLKVRVIDILSENSFSFVFFQIKHKEIEKSLKYKNEINGKPFF
ncbi:MAG: hypothetical protein DRJ01_17805 [Bacteroidetes bacterium]|nr:MAG: hypothetical protein DRJ01_17805 [Bacteroidota bacterium]